MYEKSLYIGFYLCVLVIALVGAYLKVFPADLVYFIVGTVLGHGAGLLPNLGGGETPPRSGS